MSLKRYAARRDANEHPIVEALRAAGATVYQLSQDGVPDLLVSYVDRQTGASCTVLIEVKTAKGKLTEAQEQFMDEWLDHNVFIVKSVEEALSVIGAI